MEPGYLEEQSDQSNILRRLLYSAGVVVAAADGKVDPSEITALGALLGSDHVNGALNVETARKDLEGRIAEAVKQVPLVKRGQVMQHLTIIAAADGIVDDSKLAELRRISDKLGVDFSVVTFTMAAAASPMD